MHTYIHTYIGCSCVSVLRTFRYCANFLRLTLATCLQNRLCRNPTGKNSAPTWERRGRGRGVRAGRRCAGDVVCGTLLMMPSIHRHESLYGVCVLSNSLLHSYMCVAQLHELQLVVSVHILCQWATRLAHCPSSARAHTRCGISPFRSFLFYPQEQQNPVRSSSYVSIYMYVPIDLIWYPTVQGQA